METVTLTCGRQVTIHDLAFGKRSKRLLEIADILSKSMNDGVQSFINHAGEIAEFLSLATKGEISIDEAKALIDNDDFTIKDFSAVFLAIFEPATENEQEKKIST
ncbi:MAG: hypothetical protein D6735_10515 [Acidobacteria bacterium]|nr:MAG: hypothetical protein D6735_10515 [Acidobacteriota bacterium]